MSFHRSAAAPGEFVVRQARIIRNMNRTLLVALQPEYHKAEGAVRVKHGQRPFPI